MSEPARFCLRTRQRARFSRRLLTGTDTLADFFMKIVTKKFSEPVNENIFPVIADGNFVLR